MSDQTNTRDAPQPAPLLGQGVLSLPGIGDVRLVWSERGLVVLSLSGELPEPVAEELVEQGLRPPPEQEVPEQFAQPLRAYADGEPVEPAELPVDLRGTDFQRRVWQALRRIPRGSVRSYASIAADVDSPRAMRAVGAANRANPIAIVVPCHRVVEADAGLGGYAGGLELKRRLLELEGVRVDAGRVIPGQLELWR